MKKTLYLFLSSLLLISCEEDEKREINSGPTHNTASYIQGFFELNDINVTPLCGFKVDKESRSIDTINAGLATTAEVYEIADGVGISVLIGTEGIGKGLINWKVGGAFSSYYNELVEKIGDTSYNSTLMYGFKGSIIAVADTLEVVTISCDKQIDENHPARSSLNDIFTVYFEDPFAVIKNGYKSLTDENHYSLEGIPEKFKKFPYSLYGAKLSLVNFVEKPYIGTIWAFILESTPESTGEYIFTVSITNKQGVVISKDANPIQLKGSL